MNPGQQMFHDFVIERAQAGKAPEIEALMTESFRRQDEGTFTKEYLAATAPALIALIRPECVAEFKQAMAHFTTQLK